MGVSEIAQGGARLRLEPAGIGECCHGLSDRSNPTGTSNQACCLHCVTRQTWFENLWIESQ